MTTLEYFSKCWFVLPVVSIVAYLLGSINFAILVTRRFSHDDIRNHGSGNAGATNVLRSQGAMPALLTTVGDISKSVAAVLFARWFAAAIEHWLAPEGCTGVDPVTIAAYAAGLFGILGHLFPMFFQFRGGKGVLSTLGMFLVLDWRVALTCLGIFLLLLVLFRMVSLGSVISIGLGPVMVWIYQHLADGQSTATVGFCACMSVLVALLIFIKHWPNIRRIASGTESKITFRKKKEG